MDEQEAAEDVAATTEEEGGGGEEGGLSEVLEARASFYEMLASFYFNPLTVEQIEAMAEADLSAYAEINEDFAEGFNDITRYLRRRNSGTRQTLAVDFTAAFAGTSTYEGKTAVPYKSVFTDDEGLLYQEGYQEVSRAFRKERIKRREGLDWPDDHISFMFQFMAVLSRRTEENLADGDTESARHNLETSADFLEKHIASWFDEFSDLANKLIKTRFYRGVLKITHGFIVLDKETISDLLAEIGE